MFQKHDTSLMTPEELAELGTEAIAYMRKITASEIEAAFPGTEQLDPSTDYWALFAANGTPLVISTSAEDVAASAFYQDFQTIRPN